jgi:hypothetical protein
MITSIIFSKDRPLQLDLTLKSISKNFKDTNDIVVLEKYSEAYQESLNNVKIEHPNIKFITQSNSIYADICSISINSNNKYICFFTDDNIVYRQVSQSVSYDNLFSAPQVVCLSLRLGKNIHKRFHHGREMSDELNHYQEIGDYVFVPKTMYIYGSYWSYSHSVDGHVFRKSEIIDMFSQIEYLSKKFQFKQTPNEVETQMQRFWPISGNFMVCTQHSTVVNSPNNRVSKTHTENFSGEHFMYESEFLLGKYMNGKRIDMDLLDLSNIVCPHQEIDILNGLI